MSDVSRQSPAQTGSGDQAPPGRDVLKSSAKADQRINSFGFNNFPPSGTAIHCFVSRMKWQIRVSEQSFDEIDGRNLTVVKLAHSVDPSAAPSTCSRSPSETRGLCAFIRTGRWQYAAVKERPWHTHENPSECLGICAATPQRKP